MIKRNIHDKTNSMIKRNTKQNVNYYTLNILYIHIYLQHSQQKNLLTLERLHAEKELRHSLRNDFTGLVKATLKL